MANLSLTTGAQAVTTTGAVTPTAGLDISGIAGDYTVHLRVQQLSAASGTCNMVIQLEDSVNAFTASVPKIVQEVAAVVDGKTEIHFSWKKYQLPALRAGVTSAVARWNITALNGTTPTATVDSWIEN